MSRDIELEERKARNRAWLEFAKQQEAPVDELYLEVGDRFERIVSVCGSVITTAVDDGLRQHPVEVARVVPWHKLPEVAKELAWTPNKDAAETSFD